MTKSTLTAVAFRFSKPQRDGSFGVIVFNKKKTWRPTKKESEQIDNLCDMVCDMIVDDVIPPEASVAILPGRVADEAFEDFDHEALLERGLEGKQYTVGLFSYGFVHAEHRVMQ